MLDSNTKFEIQNEVEIFCQDLRMFTIQTDRVFQLKPGELRCGFCGRAWAYCEANICPYRSIITIYADLLREPDGYREDGRLCSR